MTFATLLALAAGPVVLDAPPPPERPYRLVVAANVGVTRGVRVAAREVRDVDPSEGYDSAWGLEVRVGTLTWEYTVQVVIEHYEE